MLNAISVDVEEYFHASNMESVAPPAKWHGLASRVDYSTRQVLECFAANKVQGTFFILGYVARRWPRLVRDIADAGHEIASHGYSHRLAYSQTERAFYRDVYRTKRLLEDLSGKAVAGYRAPSFSITSRNPWAYEQLVRAGYNYDSSRYPTWHPRYGNRQKSRLPERIICASGSLLILPLAVYALNFLGKELRFPVGGGAYWRLLPQGYLTWGLRGINENEHKPFNCYFHPWEFDAQQPRFEELPYLTQLRHYGGISSFPSRIEFFLKQFKFSTVSQLAQSVPAAEIKSVRAE